MSFFIVKHFRIFYSLSATEIYILFIIINITWIYREHGKIKRF